MRFRISWFREPKKVELGDIVLGSIVFSLFVIFAPESYFMKINIGAGSYAIFIGVSIVIGIVSAYRVQNRSSNGPDVFFIRAWWALSSGIVALPICFFVRREAIPFASIMLIIGAGEILGNYTYRRLFGKN